MSTPTPADFLKPILGLNIWTFVQEAWMYSTRLPGIAKYYGGSIPNTTPPSKVWDKMPPSIRWKADNYNHLFEQPTQFYAVALVMAVMAKGATGAGGVTGTDVKLAWAYVGLRVLHSLVQSVGNRIPLRFGVFVSSSAVLAVMTARAAMALME
jgi:hypothetical protein